MKPKFLLLLLASAAISEALDVPNKRDAFDDADLLLQEFSITVEEVVTSAQQILDETWDHVLETANAIRNLAQRLLYDTQRGWLAELEVLAQVAAGLDEQAQDCVTQAQNNIIRAPSSYINEINLCVSSRTTETRPQFYEIFSNLDNARQSVRDFQRRIDECRRADDQVCVIVVVTQIEAQNALLPVILANDVQELRGQLSSAEDYYQDCTVSPTSAYNIHGRTVVETARLCVQ